MPTDGECLAFWEEELAKGIDAWKSTGEAIEKRWPDPAEQMAYLDWCCKRTKAPYEQKTTSYEPKDPEDLKKLIDTTNYNDDFEHHKLFYAVHGEVFPDFHIGTYRNGGIYRIITKALLDICVLGVNTNVQPKIPLHRRMDNLPAISTKFNESEDSEITRFVFHQIGILEFWESWGGDGGGSDEDNDVESSKDVDCGIWRPTGFHVVVRFRRSSAANGIYMIYNFYPKDEEGDHYLKINSHLPDDKTGQQFSMAKIADTMRELQHGRLFTLMEVFDYPVEIVMTWETPEGIIARVTVA
ncbi:MAG: hypothetical protein M1839_006776 [Geoglossum umbratile]|nr:MAG: hypothetical protein M1839_006776 [Geoglossum umbratile]